MEDKEKLKAPGRKRNKKEKRQKNGVNTDGRNRRDMIGWLIFFTCLFGLLWGQGE